MRLVSFCVLSCVLAASACRPAHAEQHFELEFGGERVLGQGVGSSYRAERRIEDIDSGKSGFVALGWSPNANWHLRLAYEQAFYRYEDPSEYYCAATAGALTGNLYCQTVSTDREGHTRDDFRAVALRLTRSWDVGTRGRINGSLGYEQARWRTRDDSEILTYSTCIGGAVVPRRLPNCRPVGLRSRANSPLLSLSYQFRLSESITTEVGAHWQSKRYIVHRNDVIPRFCARQLGMTRATCEILGSIRVADGTSTDHDWTWLFGEVSWRISENWDVAITAESGGSRNWNSVGASVRYRW